ncbi:MAG: RHS repeat-associated core domain-containing protein, partial [Bacteroidota bacterium]
ATGTISDVYDFRNKLIRRSFVGGKTILLSYDADGNRVSKQVLDTASATFSEREHHYLVDTNNHTGYAQVVEERDGSGFLTRVNHYGHDLVATDYITEGYQRYYQYDGLGSVRALSDGSGDITDTYTYDAFGLELSTTGTTANQYRYTGEQWDADLGMYFLRARYNNVQTGRFHSMDTYEGRNGEPMTLHKYLYAHANPVSYVDPSGMFSLGEQSLVGSMMNTLSRAMSFALVRAPVAIQNVLVSKGLVPISILSTYIARLGSPLINRISQTFTKAPQITSQINMWTNGQTGARAHFFNEAMKNPQRFQVIANRLQVTQFRWGTQGFQKFTELANQLRSLPVGDSFYGQVYRVTSNGSTMTFVRTVGNGKLKANDVGVLIIEHGNKIASFRDGMAQTLLSFK